MRTAPPFKYNSKGKLVTRKCHGDSYCCSLCIIWGGQIVLSPTTHHPKFCLSHHEEEDSSLIHIEDVAEKCHYNFFKFSQDMILQSKQKKSKMKKVTLPFVMAWLCKPWTQIFYEIFCKSNCLTRIFWQDCGPKFVHVSMRFHKSLHSSMLCILLFISRIAVQSIFSLEYRLWQTSLTISSLSIWKRIDMLQLW